MRKVKTIAAIVAGSLPVIYCGGLVYHFIDISGSPKEVASLGLGPTVIGLSVVGLICCIPLAFRIRKLFAGPRPPSSGGADGPDTPPRDKGGFDAEAAVAAYMARRPVDAPSQLAAPAARSAARPAGFGRKNR